MSWVSLLVPFLDSESSLVTKDRLICNDPCVVWKGILDKTITIIKMTCIDMATILKTLIAKRG
jgi:hypothetical protein